MSRSLFVGGTASNAGKSWMVTAICASLRRRGVRVAPFKAQTMSNHSFPCIDGGEIGRAQATQAQACGLAPESAMNPVLLKPNGDGTSQVIVRGRVWKTLSARDYYERIAELFQEVVTAYSELTARFDVVVVEGAGSVSELNLRHRDIVNLGLVTELKMPWILVADIERGGVFGSVVGTISLLTPEERALLRGFAVNKFRGDVTLFESGAEHLADRTGAPCLGIFPFADGLSLDAEDSLAIDRRVRREAPAGARAAIVSFPTLSNGTDFRLLDWARWIDAPVRERFDIVILPGSKHTLNDLGWMRERGLDRWIIEQHREGATIIGICGGYQMLGERVADPHQVESGGDLTGLGLLPVTTVMNPLKTTKVRRARTSGGAEFDAYEIHTGVTTPTRNVPAFAWLEDGTADGVRADRVIGTYLHGCLESPAVCRELFGVELQDTSGSTFERLADWLETHARHRELWELA